MYEGGRVPGPGTCLPAGGGSSPRALTKLTKLELVGVGWSY
jgi:hypothetical protein